MENHINQEGDMNEMDRGEWRKAIAEDMAGVKGDMTEVKGDMAEVKAAIIGNKDYRRLGLMERVEKIEAWQTANTIKIAFIAGTISGGVSGAAEFVKWLLK